MMLSFRIKNANIVLAITFLLACLDHERSDPRSNAQRGEPSRVPGMSRWRKDGFVPGVKVLLCDQRVYYGSKNAGTPHSLLHLCICSMYTLIYIKITI